MTSLWVVAGAGFAASFVDGALGMGFGPTSSTILLASGLSPSASSATINVAKVATGAAAGISHWRFGNIDRRLVLRLAVPGCLGAVLGVTVLSNVDGARLRPWLAVLLFGVGLRMLLRFVRSGSTPSGTTVAHADRGTAVAGALGGVTNGLVGAWGPVVTPYLLQRGVAARTAIGSVNTAEVPVAAVAAGSLVSLLASGSLDVGVVVAMLVGGVVAAPVAAWSVRFLPPRPLGLAVACLLLLTNAGPASRLLGLDVSGVTMVLTTLAVLGAVGAAVVVRERSSSPRAASAADRSSGIAARPSLRPSGAVEHS